MYISSLFTSCRLSRITHDIEHLFIECAMNSKRILIGAIYRPPGGDVDTYMESLENLLSTHLRCDELIIVDDFNLNLLNIDYSFPAATFLNVMKTYSLLHTFTKPTRIDRDIGC